MCSSSRPSRASERPLEASKSRPKEVRHGRLQLLDVVLLRLSPLNLACLIGFLKPRRVLRHDGGELSRPHAEPGDQRLGRAHVPVLRGDLPALRCEPPHLRATAAHCRPAAGGALDRLLRRPCRKSGFSPCPILSWLRSKIFDIFLYDSCKIDVFPKPFPISFSLAEDVPKPGVTPKLRWSFHWGGPGLPLKSGSTSQAFARRNMQRPPRKPCQTT